MPAPQEGQHRWINDTAMPFATNVSPVDETPYISKGYNCMATIRHVLERRPGFATAIETRKTTFAGRIANIFTWRRWNGANYIMLSVIIGNTSTVQALRIGDASFTQLISVAGTIPFDFVFSNNCCFMGNGTANSMQVYDGTNLYRWGLPAPTVAPVCNLSNVQSGMTCETDYHYRYTYWDANAGHESGPSDVNDCIGTFTNSGVAISVRRSIYSRVTHIRIYRTTDGGSTDPSKMQELPISPVANADSTVVDYANDGDLRNKFCPALAVNDPPPPLLGLQKSASRIYGFTGNQVWFSGYDEITSGVQEECFKSGLSGNYYPFSDQIGALQPMSGENAGMSTFMPALVYMITGELRNQLDRNEVEQLHGARYPQNTTSYGADVVWYDTSGQVRAATAGEISTEIRDIVGNFDPQWVQIKTHVGQNHQWICVLDGISGILYVYDRDLHCWQTPWPISATAIHSGEITPGKRVLYAAINGSIYYMTLGKYNDAGTPYPALMRTGMIPLAPLATTSNQILRGVNPALIQAVDAITIERDLNQLADVRYALDEKPTDDTVYTSIFATEDNPTYRQPSKTLIAKRYTVAVDKSLAERMSVELSWPAVDSNFELYSIDAEIHPQAQES